MNAHPCWECASTNGLTRLPHGRICVGCRRRRHYHPETCPRCELVRPLAWLRDDVVVCASCAGVESIFACIECGREDHPYGLNRCARCFLRERLTDLLTDPETGQIHHQLGPVFDELVNSERPQTGLWWLRKKPGVGPQLLGQMACGAVEISPRHLPRAALGSIPRLPTHTARRGRRPGADRDPHRTDAALDRGRRRRTALR